jgi:hypothetical protein
MRKIWRWLAVFLAGGVLGTGFGVALGFFAYPFVFPPPAAMDELRAGEGERLVATGTFIHANPSDPIHYGSGGVQVFEDVVFLGDDFEVGPGPDYHVYLVPTQSVRNDAAVEGTMYIDLGRLRAFEGSQRYPIPAGVDLANYPSVVIWCQKFGVLISPADLNPAGT